MADALQVV